MKSPETTLKRPTALTVVALLFVVGGFVGTLTEVSQRGGLRLLPIPSWNLLNMIAGFGLLKLWRYARIYTLLATGSALASTMIGIFIASGSHQTSSAIFLLFYQTAEMSAWTILTLLIACAASFAAMLSVLLSRNVRALFQVRHA
jgi:hypothetical protein